MPGDRVPNKRPTITDVAKLCGVSPATVSRVLNGKQRSAATAVRERILQTARKLGYAPDLSARNLTRGHTHVIGIFSSWRTHINQGINEGVLDGMTSVLHPGGYDVFFELEPKTPTGRAMPAWRFDGAILLQAPSAATVIELDRRRIPYVCVNERVGHADAYVLADDAMGMARAVEHLAQLGHKRIAYANAYSLYLDHYSVGERYSALVANVRKNGLELVPGHDMPFSTGAAFLNVAVVAHRATAVIAYDHAIAFAILGGAYELGLKIPQSFSLVCFNDIFPVWAMPPPLTAVSVAGNEMGQVGATLLLNSLTKPGHEAGGQTIRIAESLVVRASTAPPPAS